MAVQLSFRDHYILQASGYFVPLSKLDRPDDRIRGRLEFIVNGQALPNLDDVDLRHWLRGLARLAEAVQRSHAVHLTVEEGEPNSPAYRLERVGHAVHISSVNARGGRKADPRFNAVECSCAEFVEAVESFLARVRAQLGREAPYMAEAWWTHQLGSRTEHARTVALVAGPVLAGLLLLAGLVDQAWLWALSFTLTLVAGAIGLRYWVQRAEEEKLEGLPQVQGITVPVGLVGSTHLAVGGNAVPAILAEIPE